MTRYLRRTTQFVISSAAALVLTTASVAVDAASIIDKLATYKGADRAQILEAGARKEGTLTFYTAMIVDQAVRPLKAAFEKKYPFVELKYARNNPGIMVQKMIAESRAGRPVADVAESAGIEAAMKRSGLARPFWSPAVDKWPANRKDPEGYSVPSRYSYLGLSYNKNLISKNQVPKSFEGLLDPKLKGKMIWSKSVAGGPLFITAVRNFMGEAKAMAYLEKLGKQDIASTTASNRAVLDRVVAGEYALSLDAFLHHPIISAAKGAPVAPQPIEPVLTIVSSVLLPKNPPHPHAALLFIDFLLSKDGQQILREARYFPAHPEVEPLDMLSVIVPSKIGLKENFISPDHLSREHKNSSKIFKKYFR